MGWLPDVSTIGLGSLFRGGNSLVSKGASEQLPYNTFSDVRVGYTRQSYQNGDMFTLQTVALATIRQPITVEKQNLTNVPKVQIGDMLSGRGIP